MKNENQRCYRIRDSKLCVFVDNICGIIAEDMPALEEYGITEQDILDMKETNEAFKWMPEDIDYRTDVSLHVEAKNDMKESIIKTMKSMSQRVALKWGNKSQEYQQLGSQMLSTMSQIELLSSARTVHTMMTEYLPNLIDVGLTQKMLDDFAILINKFEANKNERIKAEKTRLEKSTERAAMGNELYAKLKRVCSTAQVAVPHKAKLYAMPKYHKRKRQNSENDNDESASELSTN